MDNKDKDIDIDNNVPNCANNGKELTTNDIVETVAVSNADPNHSGQQLQDKKVEQSTAEVKPTTSDAAKDDDTAEAMSTTSDTAKVDGTAEIKPIPNGDTKAQQNAQEVLSTNTEAMEEDDSNAWWKAYLPDAETKGETSKAKGKASATSSVENVSQYGADPEVGNVLKPEFENMKPLKERISDSFAKIKSNGVSGNVDAVKTFAQNNKLVCVGVAIIVIAIIVLACIAPLLVSQYQLAMQLKPSLSSPTSMTNKEVEKIMGEPTVIEESPLGQTWCYYTGKVATLYKKAKKLEKEMEGITSLEALEKLMEASLKLEKEMDEIDTYKEIKVIFAKDAIEGSGGDRYTINSVIYDADKVAKKSITSNIHYGTVTSLMQTNGMLLLHIVMVRYKEVICNIMYWIATTDYLEEK